MDGHLIYALLWADAFVFHMYAAPCYFFDSNYFVHLIPSKNKVDIANKNRAREDRRVG